MARFKDLADPALAAEWRRRARDGRDAHPKPHVPSRPPSQRVTAARAAHRAHDARRDGDADRLPVATDAPAPDAAAAAMNGGSNDASPAADGDVPGFASLVGPVQPLETSPRHRAHARPPAPRPRQREADEEAALLHSRLAMHPSPMAWDIGLDIEGAQSFVRPGLNPDLLRKLRRGEWVVQGALDLHRHTQEEARLALSEFLAAARRQGWRCVRIIHGKGLSSPNREPVLKGKVRKWLQHREEVLAYCEPRPHAGGGGAVVVLLNGAEGRA